MMQKKKITAPIQTEITAIITIDSPNKILSVNTLYSPASSVGKNYAWLYKAEEVRNFQDLIIEKAKHTNLANSNLDLENIKYMDVFYAFLLDKNLDKRDTTNLVKIVEDALKDEKVLNIDDSKHRRVCAIKAPSYIPNKEYIICKYTVVYK